MTKLPFDEEKFCNVCKRYVNGDSVFDYNNFTFKPMFYKIYIKDLGKLICEYTTNYYLSGLWDAYLKDAIDELYKDCLDREEIQKIEEEKKISQMFPKRD
jgi:hypothetical protein